MGLEDDPASFPIPSMGLINLPTSTTIQINHSCEGTHTIYGSYGFCIQHEYSIASTKYTRTLWNWSPMVWAGMFFWNDPKKNTAGPRKAGHHFRKPAVSGAFVHQVWLQDLLHAPRKPQGHGGNTDDVSKFLLQVPSALTWVTTMSLGTS